MRIGAFTVDPIRPRTYIHLHRAIGAAGYGAADAKTSPTNNLETSTPVDAVESSATSAADRVIDGNLADLLMAWPALPEAIKAGIMAMVKAAKV